jgi:hypothetical protein
VQQSWMGVLIGGRLCAELASGKRPRQASAMRSLFGRAVGASLHARSGGGSEFCHDATTTELSDRD